MDNRRLILLFIFLFSSYLLWNEWVKFNHPQPVVANGAPATSTAANGAVPTPSATLPAAAVPGATASNPAAPVAGQTVTVKTDLVNADISTLGGDLVQMTLRNYQGTTDKTQPFTLFGANHRYAAQTGLIGDNLPNHKSLFKLLPGPLDMGTGNELKVALEADTADGVKVVKTYTFHRGTYLVDVGYDIVNGSTHPLNTHAYFQLLRDDKSPGGEPRMVNTYTGPAFYTESDKYHKVSFSDVDKGKAKLPQPGTDGWVAMVQHYFVSAWVPRDKTPREFFLRNVTPAQNGQPGTYAAGVIVPVSPVAPGAKTSIDVPLFAGPQIQSELEKVAPGLNLVVDYGWLTIIASPIFWALEWIHKAVGNWGWAIVVLTVLIKLIFFPLSAASYKSMAKMRQITPRLQHIKEHFADDRQRMNQEMMELYRKEKINPLGGCLPIVIQIPVFIALYWVLLGAVEMRNAPWIGWITDLSTADPYYVLPVIMMISMFIQTRLNPTPPDPMQAKMMMIMPMIFGVMFFFFPAGLVLYWVVNNILSIAQQWQITRMIGAASAAANDAKA